MSEFPQQSERMLGTIGGAGARGASRRCFLGVLAGFLVLLGAPLTRVSVGAARPVDSYARDSDRAIAALGRLFRRENPPEARRLAAFASAEMPAIAAVLPARRRARLARERLLSPQRVARERERGEHVRVDGWLLARSEVAFALLLDAQLGGGRFAPGSANG